MTEIIHLSLYFGTQSKEQARAITNSCKNNKKNNKDQIQRKLIEKKKNINYQI
jgi:hypothetical protein